ncbi:Pentatricopeptide repeat-containing protein, partial [Drosera capensis]
MRWPGHGTTTTPQSLHRQVRCLLRHSSFSSVKPLHAAVIVSGLVNIPDSFIPNAVLRMYSRFGHLVRGRPVEAVCLYKEMMGIGFGVGLDEVTVLCVVNACAQLRDAGAGEAAVGCGMKSGVKCTVKLRNSVIDMYGKCGMIREARRVFEAMEERSVVTWTIMLDCVVRYEGFRSGRGWFDVMPVRNVVGWGIMIKAYVMNGFTREALALISEVVLGSSWGLNFATLCSILSACAQSGDLMVGLWVHGYVLRMVDRNVMVDTALVDMYAKCGRLNKALGTFRSMPFRNVVTWNAMLSGLAMHGQGGRTLELFSDMLKEAMPDEVTMTAVLNACSHSGLVDQGRHYFSYMSTMYSIAPQMEHYACMVDLLGRAGYLDEAEKLVRTMPMRPNEVVLGSLISSCGTRGKLPLAEKLLQDLINIDPSNTECHVLLANMYYSLGKKDKGDLLHRLSRRHGAKKVPGMSSIHVGGHVHRFTAGDKSHPCVQDIYGKLDEVIGKSKLAGYVPNISSQVSALFDEDLKVEGLEEKEQVLFSHSEKLAVHTRCEYFIIIFRQPLEPKTHDLNDCPLREENE